MTWRERDMLMDMDTILNISLGIVLAGLAFYIGQKTRK
jgi:hypothetical protein